MTDLRHVTLDELLDELKMRALLARDDAGRLGMILELHPDTHGYCRTCGGRAPCLTRRTALGTDPA